MYDIRTHVLLWGCSFAVEHKNFEMCHLAQLGIVHRLVPFKGLIQRTKKTYLFMEAFKA